MGVAASNLGLIRPKRSQFYPDVLLGNTLRVTLAGMESGFHFSFGLFLPLSRSVIIPRAFAAAAISQGKIKERL